MIVKPRWKSVDFFTVFSPCVNDGMRWVWFVLLFPLGHESFWVTF